MEEDCEGKRIILRRRYLIAKKCLIIELLHGGRYEKLDDWDTGKVI
jgi:hypothetical protein